MEKIRHLGEERVMKLIIRYSAPAIAGMVIYGLNRIVGTMFVGKFLGRGAMAGFTVANSIFMIILACVMLVGTGSSVLISITLGKKQQKEASRILGSALSLGFIFGAAIIVIGELFAEPLILVFGGRGESLAYGVTFIRIFLASTIFSFWNTTLNSAIRAEGQPGKALMTNVVSFVLNTLLMPVFLFVIPMGMAGIALANVLSQLALTPWLGIHFLGRKTILPLRVSDLRIDRHYAARMLSIGMAPFFLQFIGATLSLVTNNIIRGIAGDLGLAVAGAVFSVYFLLIMPLQGTSTGIQPIIGYNHGAKFHLRVRKTVFAALAFTTCVCVAEALFAVVFREGLSGLFTSGDTSLIALGSKGLVLVLAAFPLMGVQFVGSSYFLATGKSAQALAVNLFRSLFVLVPILTLTHFWGLNGLFLSYPLTDLLVCVLCAVLLYGGIRKSAEDTPAREAAGAA